MKFWLIGRFAWIAITFLLAFVFALVSWNPLQHNSPEKAARLMSSGALSALTEKPSDWLNMYSYLPSKRGEEKGYLFLRDIAKAADAFIPHRATPYSSLSVPPLLPEWAYAREIRGWSRRTEPATGRICVFNAYGTLLGGFIALDGKQLYFVFSDPGVFPEAGHAGVIRKTPLLQDKGVYFISDGTNNFSLVAAWHYMGTLDPSMPNSVKYPL